MKCCVCCDVQGAVDSDMLRHLATELGDEWRRLAHGLGIRSIRQQAVIRNGNSAERQNALYDMLTSWMKKMPRAGNKVGSHYCYYRQVDLVVVQVNVRCVN